MSDDFPGLPPTRREIDPSSREEARTPTADVMASKIEKMPEHIRPKVNEELRRRANVVP
jgi:hypothetical protein